MPTKHSFAFVADPNCNATTGYCKQGYVQLESANRLWPELLRRRKVRYSIHVPRFVYLLYFTHERIWDDRHGDLQHVIDTFSAQRHYLEAHTAAIDPFSGDDSCMGFHWQKEAAMSGKEIAHLFPFRAKLMRAWKLLGSPSLESFCEAFEQWPFRRAMQQHNVSEDGPFCEDDGACIYWTCGRQWRR